MAYAVIWTEWPPMGDPIDNFVICETAQEAHDRYEMLWRNNDDVWCAGVTVVIDATEPHWIDDVSDRPTDEVQHENLQTNTGA